MRSNRIFILMFLFTLWHSPLYAVDYYISPNGGTGTGSINDPWDLAYANVKLKAGDRALLRGGTYMDHVIKPANSGTAGNPIIYVAFTGETPEFRASPSKRIPSLIVLTNRSYIIVDGISADGEGIFNDSRIYKWAHFENTSYSTIQNSNFIRAKGWSAIDFVAYKNSDYNKILNNVVDTTGTWNVYPWKGVYDDSGSTFWIHYGNDYNLIEGNIFRRGGHDVGLIEGDYNVIRRNVFDNDWGVYEGTAFKFKDGDIKPGDRIGNRTFDIKGGSHNLVEENIIKNVRESVDNSAVGMIKATGKYSIVRNNYFFNGSGTGISTQIGGSEPDASFIKIYHNVLSDLGGPGWTVEAYGPDYGAPKSNIFKNNVLFNTHLNPVTEYFNAEVAYLRLQTIFGDAFQGNEFKFNCVASDNTISNQQIYTQATATIPLSEIESRFSSYFNNNKQIIGSPFVSVKPQVKSDFVLANNSECRGAADDLTVTVNSGTSNVIKVVDASYFSNGYGIIEGDMIKVGNNPAVRIVAINYSNNEITVESTISWQQNTGVNLNFSGSRPDMGILNNNSGTNTVTQILPPTNVQLIRR